ncbi:MAG: hypothetical protein WCJ56_13750 [bacterium]
MTEEEKPAVTEQEPEVVTPVTPGLPPPVSVGTNEAVAAEEAEEEERKPVPYDVVAILCGLLVLLILLFTQRTLKLQYVFLSSIAVVVVGYIILEITHPRLPYIFLSFMAGALGFLYGMPRGLYLGWHNTEMRVLTLLFIALCGVLSVIITVWIDPEENPYYALVASFLAAFVLTNAVALSLAVAAAAAIH